MMLNTRQKSFTSRCARTHNSCTLQSAFAFSHVSQRRIPAWI